MPPIVWLSVCQISTMSALIYWGQLNIVLHAALFFIVTVGVLLYRGKQTIDWPYRADVLRLAAQTFGIMWVVSTCAYCVWFFQYPEKFAFSAPKLMVIAPCVSLAPALMGLFLTLCAGDTVLFILDRDSQQTGV